jgi:hypothetical protein
MPHRLLIAHNDLTRGESHGVFVQHVETMRWLFAEDPAWDVVSLDLLHPSFPDAALTADVLVLSMCASAEIEAVIRLRRERGLRTIFEITDNVLAPVEWLAPGHPFRSPLGRQHILFHAARCDALQVYAQPLAEVFRSVNAEIEVFDPYVPIDAAIRTRPGGFVFGWGGTFTHRRDLEPLVPAIERFCARHRDATFAFMGDRAMFASLFAGVAGDQKTFRPFGPFGEYMEFVRSLHAGVAPLSPTPFNATRTDTKFVTYAAAGTAPLLQDAGVYRPHAANALLFAGPEELEAQLEKLYLDRDGLRALAARAHAWVRTFRGRDALRAQRERFYRRFLPEPPQRMMPIDDAADLVARLASPADHEEVIAVCRELLKLVPGYGRAQWQLAASLDAAGRHDEALAFSDSVVPHPIYADLFAELHARRDARRIPEVASPYRRLRLQQKEARDKLTYYRAVLDEQPYDFFALSAVIRMVARSSPESPELDELYARAALVDPESVPHARRPRELEAFLPA